MQLLCFLFDSNADYFHKIDDKSLLPHNNSFIESARKSLEIVNDQISREHEVKHKNLQIHDC